MYHSAMSSAPFLDLSAIPEDQRDAVLALLQENVALKEKATGLQSKAADLEDLVKRLEHLVAELRNAVHGKRSEKLPTRMSANWPSRISRSQWPRPRPNTMSRHRPHRHRGARSGATAGTCRRIYRGLSRWSNPKAWIVRAGAAKCTGSERIAPSGWISFQRSSASS